MKLQDLRLFLLAAREADIEIALRIRPLNVEGVHLGIQFLAELEEERALAGALLNSAADKGGDGKSGHLHRILEGHEHARPGALVRRLVLNILTIKNDLSLCDLVSRISHQSKAKRRFAGAVGAHQHVCLAAADCKVHTL